MLAVGAAMLSGCATSRVPVHPAHAAEASAPRPTDWEIIGSSRDGRAIRAVTLPGRGARPLRAAIIASIHGNEREGGRHLDELVPLLSGTSNSIRIYEDANPDGTWRNVRTTTKGVDPNRNWPAENFSPSRQRGPAPLSEPGVAAVHGDLVTFAPELVIVLHSTKRGPFVNYDGPAEFEASVFAEAAGTAWSVQPSMGYPTPGSLGSWMGVDRGVPILTIEFDRDCDPKDSRHGLLTGMAATFGVQRRIPAHVSPTKTPTSASPFRVL